MSVLVMSKKKLYRKETMRKRTFLRWTEDHELYVLSSNDTFESKAAKTGHTEASVKMRLANALFVLTNGRTGLSNYAKQTKRLALRLKQKDGLCDYLRSGIQSSPAQAQITMEFTGKVASTVEEASKLIEAGFEYVSD